MLKNNTSSLIRSDRLLIWSLTSLAALTALILLLVGVFVFWESIPAFNEIGVFRFISDQSWYPVDGSYDLTPMILGTLAVALGAILLATPIGVLSAVFSHFYAPPWIAKQFRFVQQILAGIPSVVYGFWGLVVLVPLLGEFKPPGASIAAGIIILAIMILPTVSLLSEAAIESAPRSLLEGSQALGLSSWSTFYKVLLPQIKPGIFTAILLAIARAIGETMAVLMVCGNVTQVPDGLFAPARTLTANIALEMAYAMGTHQSALFVSGTLLFMVATLIVFVAHRLEKGRIRATGL